MLIQNLMSARRENLSVFVEMGNSRWPPENLIYARDSVLESSTSVDHHLFPFEYNFIFSPH